MTIKDQLWCQLCSAPTVASEELEIRGAVTTVGRFKMAKKVWVCEDHALRIKREMAREKVLHEHGEQGTLFG